MFPTHSRELHTGLTFFNRLLLRLLRYLRRFRFILGMLAAVGLLDLFFIASIPTPSTRSELLGSETQLSQAYQQRVYIASIQWNNGAVLRKNWIPALIKLVQHWDPKDIFVSISESGSWDGAKGALLDLDHELGMLGIERSIQLSNHTHADALETQGGVDDAGWIQGPNGNFELRRLPYLAAERNKAMTPLKELAHRNHNPRSFDKVLWLNDVIFSTDEVAALINTRDGDYAAACSMDFKDPPNSQIYYDTFALRDLAGQFTLSQQWPWFSNKISRNAAMAFTPVPVQSCWNGMVSFDAAPFRSNLPLQFRAIPDTLADLHVEGSECCLIHIDNPLAADKGVWLNPNVRVSYNEAADKVVNSEEYIWPTTYIKFKGIWANRWARWITSRDRMKKRRLLDSRLTKWEAGKLNHGEPHRRETGRLCLVDEMQVLRANGWSHV